MSSIQKSHKEYQRLEFLGDRVLNLIVSQYLYTKFQEFSSGLLTDRLKFTSNDNLEEIFDSLPDDLKRKIHDFQSGFKLEGEKSNADAIEAYVGNYTLKQGLYESIDYFEKIFAKQIDEFNPDRDYISKLQVRTQEKQILPRYEQIGSDSPDENNIHHFHLRVFIGEKLAGEGFGLSKMKAKKEAAKNAWFNFPIEN